MAPRSHQQQPTNVPTSVIRSCGEEPGCYALILEGGLQRVYIPRWDELTSHVLSSQGRKTTDQSAGKKQEAEVRNAIRDYLRQTYVGSRVEGREIELSLDG